MVLAPLKAGNKVPPQVPVYHLHPALAPKLPPLTVNWMFSPTQMLLKSRLDVTEVGAVDASKRVTLKLAVDTFPYTSVAV
jgi:hypothetical protein